ncbi:MAG TPA: hypothetical protein PKV33_06890 [Methanothrix sp.]|nr:hypothetical protein [Methanothrix sp.]
MEKIAFPEVDVRMIVGREIAAGRRTIWPVIKITVIKGCGESVLAIEASPIAMLITDDLAGAYAVSISGKPMTVGEILEIAPHLRDVLTKKEDARTENGKD